LKSHHGADIGFHFLATRGPTCKNSTFTALGNPF
jgi:hypothetical protein